MGDSPLIVRVRRHSLEDGPGIRSVAFFKGCPLRCVFCHNPEAQDPRMEIAFFARDCTGCGACLGACLRGAIDPGDPLRIRRSLCDRCGACADACPTGSLRRVGTPFTVEALAELLLRDLPFYRRSGGGVTLSGGEPAMWPWFVGRLLERLKAEGVHVVLETSGFFDWEEFGEAILPGVDLVYYDLKFADPEEHRRYTGERNDRALANLKRLIRSERTEVRARIPLVPGVTATEENLAGIVALLRGAGAEHVCLLPYNPLGLAMYPCLGRPTPPVSDRFPSRSEMDELHAAFRRILGSEAHVVGAPVSGRPAGEHVADPG